MPDTVTWNGPDMTACAHVQTPRMHEEQGFEQQHCRAVLAVELTMRMSSALWCGLSSMLRMKPLCDVTTSDV